MAAASGSVSSPASPRPADRTAWWSRSILYRPQLAGWVTVMASGGAALLGDDGVEEVAEELDAQGVGRPRRAAEEQRRGVAEPALELPGQAAGILQAPAGGGVAHQEGAVLAQEQHRRHRRRAVGQGHHLGPTVAGHGGARERRAEVEAQCVSHGRAIVQKPGTGHSGGRGERGGHRGAAGRRGRVTPRRPVVATCASASSPTPAASPAPTWSSSSPASSRPARAPSSTPWSAPRCARSTTTSPRRSPPSCGSPPSRACTSAGWPTTPPAGRGRRPVRHRAGQPRQP